MGMKKVTSVTVVIVDHLEFKERKTHIIKKFQPYLYSQKKQIANEIYFHFHVYCSTIHIKQNIYSN